MALSDFLFGKTTLKSVPVSENLRDSLNITTGESMDRYRRRKGETLDAFQGFADRTLPKAEGQIHLSEADLNRASQLAGNYNPMGTYERIRGGNISALQGLADSLAGIGRRQESELSARLGMAGRPMSSARDLMRASGTAAAMSPLAQGIFANLGRDTSGISADVMNQAQMLRSLAASRPDLYNQLYNLALAPLNAEGQALGTETNALGALANAYRQNFAGMDVQKKMGLTDYSKRLSEQMSATTGNLADAVNNVASIYGNVMTGGMTGNMEGMMGGMGGGGGGMFGAGGQRQRGSLNNPNMNWGGFNDATQYGQPQSYPMQTQGGVYNIPSWSWNSAPVDMSMANPLQMQMLQNAQRAASVNVPKGSVWE